MSAPVAGPLFHRAASLPVGGRKRQKVVALVAAYIDGGADHSPPIPVLAERSGLRPAQIVTLADRLAADGWLVRLPGKKRKYTLGEWRAGA